MPKTKNILPSVVWKDVGAKSSNKKQDDFVYSHGGYTLRVEQMDRNYWWWAVYFDKTGMKDEEVAFSEPQAKTEMEAKLLAELHYVRHYYEHLKK